MHNLCGLSDAPSSEVAEAIARELPKVRGICIEMEDEIALMGAVIGASMGGVKSTSPNISVSTKCRIFFVPVAGTVSCCGRFCGLCMN